jgi:MarR family transcriptional regulator, transcriptional regulator for hemolysin
MSVAIVSTLIICAAMETIPFEIAETAHALRRSFDRRAATLGVTRAQWKVLFRLSRTPCLRQVELADKLDVEPITLSRIIDRLADAGLVERTADPTDRRAWRLQVTETAQPLVAKLRKLADALIDDAFQGLTEDELNAMRGNLARIRENLAAAEGCRKAANQ